MGAAAPGGIWNLLKWAMSHMGHAPDKNRAPHHLMTCVASIAPSKTRPFDTQATNQQNIPKTLPFFSLRLGIPVDCQASSPIAATISTPSLHLFIYFSISSLYFSVCGRKPPKSQSTLQHLLSLQQKTHEIAEEEISTAENPQITERKTLFGTKPLNQRK